MLTENLVEDIIDNFIRSQKPIHHEGYSEVLQDLINLREEEVKTVEVKNNKIVRDLGR